MKKKFLALVMTLSMVLSLVPMTALATGDNQVDTVAAGETTNAGTNEGSQDSGSPTGGDNAGSGDSADTSEAPGANNKDEGKDSGSENTDETTPGSPSKPEGGTPSGGGTTEPTEPATQKNAAKIGETEYLTITAAIDAIQEESSDNTITLLRDVEENITIGKSLTLDLVGFKLTGTDEENAVVTITGSDGTKPTVTIKSSKVDGEKPVNGTITGGRNPQNGGGFAIDSAVVRLEDLTITGNEAVGGNGNGEVGGGGIYASHADVSMRIVTVSENSVTGSSSDGGGILVRYGSLTMDGCHVEGNTAPDCGGGMILRHSELNATKSFFENNTAKFGAGIYFGDTPNEAEEGCSGEHNHLITDSTISGNTVLDPENGIGGGMYVGTTSNLTLRNSKLLNNDGAIQGGAIVAYSAGTI